MKVLILKTIKKRKKEWMYYISGINLQHICSCKFLWPNTFNWADTRNWILWIKYDLKSNKNSLTEDFTECIPTTVYTVALYISLTLSNNSFLDETLLSSVSVLWWDISIKWFIHWKNFSVNYIIFTITGPCYAGGHQSVK